MQSGNHELCPSFDFQFSGSFFPVLVEGKIHPGANGFDQIVDQWVGFVSDFVMDAELWEQAVYR